MHGHKEKQYRIYHAILSMALSLALSLALNTLFHLKVFILIPMISTIIFSMGIFLLDENKKNGISYLILFTIIAIIGMILWLYKINIWEWIKGLIHWCKIYNGTDPLYNLSYAIGILILINLFASLLFYLIMKIPFAKLALALLLTVSLFILAFNQIDLSKMVIGIIFFYMISIITEVNIMVNNKKVDRKDNKGGFLYLIPVCILLTILAICLPSKDEPIQWKGVKTFFSFMKEKVEMIQINLDYAFQKENDSLLSFVGYSDDGGDLSTSDLQEDSKVALKVREVSKNSSVYLTGFVRDKYIGDRWEKGKETSNSGENEYLLDYAELFYALSRQDPEILENHQFVKSRKIHIEYHLIKTTALFYPTKTHFIWVLSKEKHPNTNEANIVFPKAVSKGTTYRLNYYEMNLNGEAFQEMLRKSDGFSYENHYEENSESVNWVENHNISFSIQSLEDLNNALKERAKHIQQEYTQLPDSLPKRVEDLAYEITKNYNSTYDKLKAIEAYLKNYNYTLYPEQAPEKWDFVDYFLFESMEGYCTSFATSMAVLARCIGVPTRYVEGFVLDYDQIDEDKNYLIKSNQAHAWAEAYLEGVGWIPFEATPVYYSSRYNAWPENKRNAQKEITNNKDYYIYQNEEDFFEELAKGSIEESFISNQAIETRGFNYKRIIKPVLIALGALFLLIFSLVAYYLWLRYRYKKRFQKADWAKSMYQTFLGILWSFQLEGYELHSSDTILSFADRVNKDYIYKGITFLDIAHIFMKYRYGKAEVTKEDYEKTVQFYEGLKEAQRKKWNFIKYHGYQAMYLIKNEKW